MKKLILMALCLVCVEISNAQTPTTTEVFSSVIINKVPYVRKVTTTTTFTKVDANMILQATQPNRQSDFETMQIESLKKQVEERKIREEKERIGLYNALLTPGLEIPFETLEQKEKIQKIKTDAEAWNKNEIEKKKKKK